MKAWRKPIRRVIGKRKVYKKEWKAATIRKMCSWSRGRRELQEAVSIKVSERKVLIRIEKYQLELATIPFVGKLIGTVSVDVMPAQQSLFPLDLAAIYSLSTGIDAELRSCQS